MPRKVEALLTVSEEGEPIYSKSLEALENFFITKEALRFSCCALGMRVDGKETVIFGKFSKFHSIEVLKRIVLTCPGEVKSDFLNFFQKGDTSFVDYQGADLEYRKAVRLESIKRDHARAVKLLRLCEKFNLPGAISCHLKQIPALPGFVTQATYLKNAEV